MCKLTAADLEWIKDQLAKSGLQIIAATIAAIKAKQPDPSA